MTSRGLKQLIKPILEEIGSAEKPDWDWKVDESLVLGRVLSLYFPHDDNSIVLSCAIALSECGFHDVAEVLRDLLRLMQGRTINRPPLMAHLVFKEDADAIEEHEATQKLRTAAKERWKNKKEIKFQPVASVEARSETAGWVAAWVWVDLEKES
jgi:hypothetical protein